MSGKEENKLIKTLIDAATLMAVTNGVGYIGKSF